MSILFIGDVVGDSGCAHVRRLLPGLKETYHLDMVIANGENSAQGNGILPGSARHLFDSGVDVITTGNHAFRRRESNELFSREGGLIRPANYHSTAPGVGMFCFDALKFRVCVINLQGVVYMQPIENPFDCVDRLLKTVDTPNIIVDFHAEATAEKLCMGYYLDGRVSAVIGTHTHVPTADARVLPGGTGYVTDAGMCGGLNSVLGVRRDLAISRMRTNLPVRFENDPEDCRLSGVVLQLDRDTGTCIGIESLVML
ncbi:TIGR00282 family metallophosphoesterase [Ruminococcaceae bacterium OttesenSCG-928-L11]|nr:TIGR00282 family metallophosphoesterase [Ruminococcaceae bacterium OttesenSCG-928-L11]